MSTIKPPSLSSGLGGFSVGKLTTRWCAALPNVLLRVVGSLISIVRALENTWTHGVVNLT